MLEAIRFLKLAFPQKTVLALPGNHEHYTLEIHSNLANMAAEAAGSNIHFLHDGDVVEIDGVLFCGATLWINFCLVDDTPEVSMKEAMESVTDFHTIRSADANLSPAEVLAFHEQHVDRIFAAMKRALVEGKPLIVATHHAPCAQSLMYGAEWTGKYLFDPRDPWYASHLDYLMEWENAPRIWIHGHSHIAVDYVVGNTRVLSNPKGYGVGDECGWEIGKIVELSMCG